MSTLDWILVVWVVVIPVALIAIGALVARVRARGDLVVRVRLDPPVKDSSA